MLLPDPAPVIALIMPGPPQPDPGACATECRRCIFPAVSAFAAFTFTKLKLLYWHSSLVLRLHRTEQTEQHSDIWQEHLA